MLLKHVRGYVIKELKVRLTILLCLIATLIAVGVYYQKSLYTEDDLRHKFDRLRENVALLQKNLDKSEGNLKAWNTNIKDIIGDRSGLKVQSAKAIIERLKQNNRVSNINISLSNPEIRTNFTSVKYTYIEYSNVDISFTSVTDIDGIRFIFNLFHELPGYVQVKELWMDIDKDTEAVLDSNVSVSKVTSLVRFKLGFLWQDYEDIEKAQKKTLNGGLKFVGNE